MGRNFLDSSSRHNVANTDAASQAFRLTKQNLPTSMHLPCRTLLTVLLLWLACLPCTGNAQAESGKNEHILFDVPPQATPPPLETSDSLNSDFKAKRDRRLRREDKTFGTVDQRAEKKELTAENTKKIEEILKDKPLLMHMAASLVLPKITTTGNQRKNYTAEPTAHVHLYLRPSDSKLTENIQVWTGFRLAPFAGSATYQKKSGRYGFTYFGPMLGVGHLTDAPKSVSKEVYESKDGLNAFHRTGYFVMGGVAAQSRESGLDKGVDPPAKELNTKGAAYDAPGLWFEYTVVSMDYNAVSYNYTVGAQTGEAKAFIYVGFGTGFWY